jgi:hypothetical protein
MAILLDMLGRKVRVVLDENAVHGVVARGTVAACISLLIG